MHGYYIFYKIIINAYFNNEIKKLKIVNKKKIKNTDISFKYLFSLELDNLYGKNMILFSGNCRDLFIFIKRSPAPITI